MTNQHQFTLEEANALLPQLEVILARLIKNKESHDRLHDYQFMDELLHEATKHHSKKEDDLQRLASEASLVDGKVFDLEEDLKKIRALGCFLRNLEHGWVDFPAQQDGKNIFYCWKKGETRVAYYRNAQITSLERFPL